MDDNLGLGIAGMRGSIAARQLERYGCTGEREPGTEFQFEEKTFVVREANTLTFESRHYNCPCFLCSMNKKCCFEFLYISGECFWSWRKDGKKIYFEEK